MLVRRRPRTQANQMPPLPRRIRPRAFSSSNKPLQAGSSIPRPRADLIYYALPEPSKQGAAPRLPAPRSTFVGVTSVLYPGFLSRNLQVFAFKWHDLQRIQVDVIETAGIDGDRVAAIRSLASTEGPHATV